MSGLAPRAVLVTRETDYDLLLARHATVEMSRFVLRSRSGQNLDGLRARHDRFEAALHEVRAAIPADWRQAHAERSQLDRFLFGPEDVVIAVGQDGLVANVAKYLNGQPVIGVNPEPERNAGVLVPFRADRIAKVLPAAAARKASLERRTMVRAVLDDGQTLHALNEIFLGHASHQSARYRIAPSERTARGEGPESQSSSGVIVASGTGATGWALSIARATGAALDVAPTERAAAFFVREPFPSPGTGTEVRSGRIEADGDLLVVSNMNDGGVLFADGIETDRLRFDWGRVARIGPADRTLDLVRE